MTAKPKEPMRLRWSIFRPVENEDMTKSETQNKRMKRWKFIHVAFKAKLFVPFVWYMERKLKKYMIQNREDIPDEPYNENILALWDTVDQGIPKWWNKFRGLDDGLGDKEWQESSKHQLAVGKLNCVRIPTFFMRLYLTIVLEDTAYREQFNYLAYEFYSRMLQLHHPDKPIIHPMYVVQYDYFFPYFIEWIKLKGIDIDLNLKIESKAKYVPGEGIDHRDLFSIALQIEEAIQNERRKQEQSRVCSTEERGNKGTDNVETSGTVTETRELPGSVPDTSSKTG